MFRRLKDLITPDLRNAAFGAAAMIPFPFSQIRHKDEYALWIERVHKDGTFSSVRVPLRGDHPPNIALFAHAVALREFDRSQGDGFEIRRVELRDPEGVLVVEIESLDRWTRRDFNGHLPSWRLRGHVRQPPPAPPDTSKGPVR